MRGATLFQTECGNRYLYDVGRKRFLLCHPVLYFLIELKSRGVDIKKWFSHFKEKSFYIEPYGTFSRHEMIYYYRKYLLLENSGYFSDVNMEKKLGGKLSARHIVSRLANTFQLVFEVTDACNLKCKYCGYGEFYTNYDKRENRNLSFKRAEVLLQYLFNLWNSTLNNSHHRQINIGFYGGEPLFNFNFIKKMVGHIKEIFSRHNYFTYSLTTNGLLLARHIDFLVENNFRMLISLDGSRENNGYRVFPDGTPAFDRILENVRFVEDRYPQYFKEKVNFNAVLHNKNSVAEIYEFFKSNFNKVPRIAEVNGNGINPLKRKEFMETYRSIQSSLKEAEECPATGNDRFFELPEGNRLIHCLHHYSGHVFKKYLDLIFPDKNKTYVPTGTCLPFSRKIFLTANGKILPCERIGRQYALGLVDGQRVKLDFQEIADRYNRYYEKIRKQCHTCYHTQACQQCIFSLGIEEKDPSCQGMMDEAAFSAYLSSCVSHLELKPHLYAEIMEEVLVE
jgi:uncharacterized protein